MTVATLWDSAADREALNQLERDGITIIAERHTRLHAAGNCLRALTGSDPLQAHFSWNERLARRLRRHIERGDVDVVHVEHLRGLRYALLLAGHATRPTPPVVWDAVDCISTLFGQAASQAPGMATRLLARFELTRTRPYEGRAVGRFDHILVTAQRDRADLLALAPAHTATSVIHVLPQGVDLEHFTPVAAAREPDTLLMTGKMSYHANARAAVWFASAVMPDVWRTHPRTRFLIVGQRPPRAVVRLAADRRVVVQGEVPDLRPFLTSATIAVAPIQYGVGIQNKVLEAMACATPTVASTRAVDGITATPGQDLLVAADAHAFAAHVRELLDDARRRTALGAAGRRFVETHHDWSRIGRELEDVYRSAMERCA